MTPEIELWRKYLRRDPTRFLLEPEANPSVYLWYLIDIAHRPEDSTAVQDARERVLFSSPVQEIFSAQSEEGYWGNPDSLSQPYYRATLWNLALLAELGIPRDSRHARSASEFMIANFMDAGGRFSSLNLVESGYMIHALAYFRTFHDERVSLGARALIERAVKANSIEEFVMLLWAWAAFRHDADISRSAEKTCERLLDAIASGPGVFAPITFPPFDPRDPLIVLRVLAIYGRAIDNRASGLVDAVLARQNDEAHWPLDRSLNGSVIPTVEGETHSSRWATLNALRVIVSLVGHGGQQ